MNNLSLNFEKYEDLTSTVHLSHDSGKVTEVVGMLIRGYLPGASIGSVVQITPSGLERHFLAEVVGFKDKYVLMMPLGDMKGISLGSKIVLSRQTASVRVSNEMLGRIVDGLGHPIDQNIDIAPCSAAPQAASSPDATARLSDG